MSEKKENEGIEISLNPCPPGYTLRNQGGTWMCVLEGAEALTLDKVRGMRARGIRGRRFAGMGSNPMGGGPFSPAPPPISDT